MTATGVVKSAIQTALILSDGDFQVAVAVETFATNCINASAFAALQQRKDAAKSALFTKFLAEKLGYTPSRKTVDFIKEHGL